MEIRSDKNGDKWLFGEVDRPAQVDPNSVNPIDGTIKFFTRVKIEEIVDFEYTAKKDHIALIYRTGARKIIKGNGEELEKELFYI